MKFSNLEPTIKRNYRQFGMKFEFLIDGHRNEHTHSLLVKHLIERKNGNL